MKPLLLVLLLVSLLNCRPGTNSPLAPTLPIQPIVKQPVPIQSSQTTTAGPAGRYLVTTYIVAGDTLHIANKAGFPIKSKLDIDNFALVITEKGNDQYTLTYSYYHNPTGEVPTFTKTVIGSVLNDYYFRFTDTRVQPGTVFDSKLQQFTKQFYQRTVGEGILIPLKGLSGPLDQTTDKEVIIVAVPQGR
ncbi:hypothetical protein [Spirosoma endophyticum]|uniref:DUF4384 domain-containing protein n=1 Tax=Spirosoma endophyticum TaxID=662367 RepID=A0A1I2I243_9BACT|nr:hypothetical protein [Spirosoma endophyticum]SFF35748.1 hypothetical protein SAMN05216167_15312 [Spirosoma endophyticum]